MDREFLFEVYSVVVQYRERIKRQLDYEAMIGVRNLDVSELTKCDNMLQRFADFFESEVSDLA